MTAARLPLATYRVQLSGRFPLSEAARLVPYLAALGVSDVYSSPVLRARTGSTHGYDVVDPAEIDPQIGGERGIDALHAALRAYDMSLLLDIVPNHMAACSENPWWTDVLEHGPDSPFARFFDIDWDLLSDSAAAPRKVLLPILGDRFGTELERGALRMHLHRDGLELRYFEHRLPLAMSAYAVVSDAALTSGLLHDAGVRALTRLRARIAAAGARSGHGGSSAYAQRIRVRRAFAELCRTSARVRGGVRAALRRLNGRPGRAASFSPLQALLDQQHYRLASWRSAAHLINYRRFFDINDLVGLRVEDRRVFAATHLRVLSLLERGIVSGLRIDHVDGLRDPERYLRTLTSEMRRRAGRRGGPPPFVVVEKILAADESLPRGWDAAGTTGYDFQNAVNGVFIDTAGLRQLRVLYARATGDRRSLADMGYRLQKDIMGQLFRAPIRALSLSLLRLAAEDRHARDLSPSELRTALVEVTACLPVYRTYAGPRGVSPADREHVSQAVAAALRRAGRRSAPSPAVDFLRRVLLLETSAPATHRNWLEFTLRWQQFSTAVAAKGVEDTAFYRFHPLLSLNAVGADPERLTAFVGVERFHARMRRRRQSCPATLNATSTHDSKRSEDVRARISVLSEMPRVWQRSLQRWRRLNAGARSVIDGAAVPDVNEELFIYQNLLGVWPLAAREERGLRPRFEQFVVKANREAKLHTSWSNPNPDYEAALVRFVSVILALSPRNAFLRDFRRLQQRIAYFGAINSLAQVLIKVTAPGIPDFYQGNELWDFSLVDPDNRRPVDFAARQRALRSLRNARAPGRRALRAALLTRWRDGRIKLFVTQAALQARRAHRQVFEAGAYLPLETTGRHKRHILAFARRLQNQWALTIVPRCVAALDSRVRAPLGRVDWADTAVALPRRAPAGWRCCFSSAEIAAPRRPGQAPQLEVSDVLDAFPVSLLLPR